MITKERFTEIKNEVEVELKNTFDELEINCPNELKAFLARGEYNDKYMNSKYLKNHVPYVISNNKDIFKDMDRIEFLSNFLNNFYSFDNASSLNDDKYRMHIELMLYCHIWESKNFLKQISRLAILVDKNCYEWDVKSPTNSKFKYIRDNIKKHFNKKQNSLSHIIDKGYHSSLRNAFAHSDYSFNLYNGNKKINLNNYGGKKWEMREISFDEWSERFVYSFLLTYLFFKEIENRIRHIPVGSKYIIDLPIEKTICIQYNGNGDFITCLG
ncbi:hypothetical protein BPO_0313 [Bergeyella porcorum]|uniref:CAAX protease n=1 Tax=Bergeyella porcorum TaxID=1735111 RepID=A0AAU0F0Z1_9FLAO